MVVGVLRIEGTNCEDEMKQAFVNLGVQAELVHLNQLTGRCAMRFRRNLNDYDALMLPGGWSGGDRVRAGAIFASRIKANLSNELNQFIEEGKPVVGVCNGFQILVEMGVLPWATEIQQAILMENKHGKFECRHIHLRVEDSVTPFTKKYTVGQVLNVPVAHGEGRFMFSPDKEEEFLNKLVDNKQVVFRYCKDNGENAGGVYPYSPNGALDDIAGICNEQGNVLGMMPHPERVTQPWLQHNWTSQSYTEGHGKAFFESIVEYMRRTGQKREIEKIKV